jgi:hypothetical protein
MVQAPNLGAKSVRSRMASDGTRIFVLGGISSLGGEVDEITLTHVLTEVRTFFLLFALDNLQV